MSEPSPPKDSLSETHQFKAEVSKVLDLVIKSLYSRPEIFLRELVSNSSDALDRLSFRALTEHDLLEDDQTSEIRIVPDRDSRTLAIEDTGAGMTREELIEQLGTIAHSGSGAFLERLAEAERAGDLGMIGQFGVGFYSSFLVADRVEVESRAAGSGQEAWCWSSDARNSFTVEPGTRAERGTRVLLHLKEDALEYLEEWRLRELVRRYSDFVAFPIRLEVTATSDLSDAGGEQIARREFETINHASALWRRSRTEIEEQDYVELYHHIAHDEAAPLAHAHFSIEGTLSFCGILFVPSRPPLGLVTGRRQRGVRLFARRIFVMDECEELVPEWLRFIRGVVDSDDLELNVSREVLQRSSMLRAISRQITRQSLDMIDDLASEKPEEFTKFWESFGAVLLEGLIVDAENRDRVIELARWRSTAGDDLTSLAAYHERMKEGQKSIYYAIGDSRETLSRSPHLEALRAGGYEVLLMTDTVDEWAVSALGKYRDVPLVSAMKAGLEVGAESDEAAGEEGDSDASELEPLLERLKALLTDQVSDVRVSRRLAESPSCLVLPDEGVHSHAERVLRAHDPDFAPATRILEINPNHALVKDLSRIATRGEGDANLEDLAHVLLAQARLAEGAEIEDPTGLAARLTRLLSRAARPAAEE